MTTTLPAWAARTVEQLCASVAAGQDPDLLCFWGHRPRPDGVLGPACLSQWWPAPFVVDGIDFATAEHYMMWRKAVLFGDEVAAELILAAPTPAKAKSHGRAIQSYDDDTWAASRWQAVVDGSVAKFSSDSTLHGYLAGTGTKVLVEAAPNDRVWGIGLPADHPDATSPDRWPGRNLLGFALMEARALIG